MRTCLCTTLAVVLLLAAPATKADGRDEPYKFFREFVGLNENQIGTIRSGKALAKVVESTTSDEVFVFGAVYVKATPESYLEFATNIDALRKLPGYIAIQGFSDPPQLSDLDGFALEHQDIEELKTCKVGHCEVQLPTEAIEEFKQSIDWSARDVDDRVNQLARRMALQALLDYMHGGNTALGVYRDKSHPAAVAETFSSLITRLSALPVYLPELNEYLLEYPKANRTTCKPASTGRKSISDETHLSNRAEGRLSGSKPSGPCIRSS